jgi:hypothetical protein
METFVGFPFYGTRLLLKNLVPFFFLHPNCASGGPEQMLLRSITAGALRSLCLIIAFTFIADQSEKTQEGCARCESKTQTHC